MNDENGLSVGKEEKAIIAAIQRGGFRRSRRRSLPVLHGPRRGHRRQRVLAKLR